MRGEMLMANGKVGVVSVMDDLEERTMAGQIGLALELPGLFAESTNEKRAISALRIMHF